MIAKLCQVICLISSCSFPQSRDCQLEGGDVPAEISHLSGLDGKAEAELPQGFPAEPRSRYPRPVSRGGGEGTAGRTCCLVGCQSPFRDTDLHHTGTQLFATCLHPREQQSPASTPSRLARLPTPRLQVPFLRPTREAQHEHKEPSVCLTLPRRRSPGHRTAGYIPSSPRGCLGRWLYLTQGKKKKKRKNSLSARGEQESGTRQEAVQTPHCYQLP